MKDCHAVRVDRIMTNRKWNHVEDILVFGHTNVMETLFQVEEQYKHIERELPGELFPGEFQEFDKARRETLQKTWAKKAEEKKIVA